MRQSFSCAIIGCLGLLLAVMGHGIIRAELPSLPAEKTIDDWVKDPNNPLVPGGFSGGAFDAARATAPAVIVDADTFRMWYTGWTPDRGSIGYATSLDGVHWTPHGTEPVIPLGFNGSYDSWHAHRPAVYKDDDTFKMWYSGDSYGQNQTCYATSTDGVNWTPGDMVIDWVTVFGTTSGWARYTYAGSVRKEDGLYRMWFSTAPPNSYIGYATSADGINWSIHDQVLGCGESGTWDDEYLRDPDVIKKDDTYYMFYSGYGDDERFQVGMASSPDGIVWTKSIDNPVLTYGPPGEWDDVSIESTSALLVGDEIYLWYDASDGDSLRIGLATATISGSEINVETWVNGGGDWIFFGDPPPRIEDWPAPGNGAFDPNGDGHCRSGAYRINGLYWRVGSVFECDFMTDVESDGRLSAYQNLQLGLTDREIYPASPCDEQDAVQPLLTLQVDITEGPGRAWLELDGVGQVSEDIPYPASLDGLWHTVRIECQRQDPGEEQVFLQLDWGDVGSEDYEETVNYASNLAGLHWHYIAGQTEDVVMVADNVRIEEDVRLIDRIAFDPLTIGQSDTMTLCINNTASDRDIRLISDADLESPFTFIEPGIQDSLSNGFTISAGDSFNTPVEFFPEYEAAFGQLITCVDITGDSTYYGYLELDGRGQPLDFMWDYMDVYTDSLGEFTYMFQPGEDVPLKVGQNGEFDIFLNYRETGGSYQSVAFDNATPCSSTMYGSCFLVTIPGTAFGPRGLELYFTAESGPISVDVPLASSPRCLQVEVDSLVFPEPQPAGQYRMISFPLDLSEVSLARVMVDNLDWFDDTRWRLFDHTPGLSADSYREIGAETEMGIELGRAYWLITRDVVQLEIKEPTGRSTPGGSFYAIHLGPGWNMIANPFIFPVAWDDIQVNGQAMSEVEDIQVSHAWWWDGSTNTDQVDLLVPFTGYWVNCLSDAVDLQVFPEEATSVTKGTGPITRPDRNDERGDGWFLQLAVTSDTASDIRNYLGVTMNAADGWDQYDRVDAPLPPTEGISLYFPHLSWESRSGYYTSDVRSGFGSTRMGKLDSERGGGHTWQFDIVKGSGIDDAEDLVTLEFRDLANLPDAAQIRLIDQRLQQQIDVRVESSYVFYLGRTGYVDADEQARFRLLIGSEDYINGQIDELISIPRHTRLYASYPNPFNPTTLIRCEFARQERVSLRVYDISGRLVTTLLDEVSGPGALELVWDGCDAGGRQAAAGLYFSRLETAAGIHQTQKMMLVR